MDDGHPDHGTNINGTTAVYILRPRSARATVVTVYLLADNRGTFRRRSDSVRKTTSFYPRPRPSYNSFPIKPFSRHQSRMRINRYGNNDSATTFQRNFISLSRNFLMSDEPHHRPFSEDYRGQRVKVRPASYYYYHLYLLFIYI